MTQDSALKQEIETLKHSGWIGVDLDGTLAVYEGWNDGEIGQPIPRMVERVKAMLAAGETVKIFTARVCQSDAFSVVSQRYADKEFADEQRVKIEEWCEKHIGQKLEVTAQKDFFCVAIWDDRAMAVIPNTGMAIGLY